MIELTNVSKWYGPFQVLDNCSMRIDKGEVVVICGPSGSGKSTLIKCINGLEPFSKGTITVDGISVGDPSTNLPKLRSRIGMVFQNFELFPHMTAGENIVLAQQKVLGRVRGVAEAKALDLLTRMGLAEHAAKYPAQLSGGQQQRVAIARALVNEPCVLLADEPTGNLDSHTSIEVMGVFQSLNDQGITIVMVTHELDIANFARRKVVMRDGLIRTDEPVFDRSDASEALAKLQQEHRAVQLA